MCTLKSLYMPNFGEINIQGANSESHQLSLKSWRSILELSFTLLVYGKFQVGFCRAMLCISAAYAVKRCVCVCVCVTFVDCVKTNKYIFKFFSPSGSHTILVFNASSDLAIF